MTCRVFDYRDRGHYAFAILDEFAAGRYLHDVQVRRKHEGQSNGRSQQSPAPATDLWNEEQVAEHNQNQCPFRAEEWQENHSEQRRRRRATESVECSRRADASILPSRCLDEMAERCTHEDRGEKEHCSSNRRLRAEHSKFAVAQRSTAPFIKRLDFPQRENTHETRERDRS